MSGSMVPARRRLLPRLSQRTRAKIVTKFIRISGIAATIAVCAVFWLRAQEPDDQTTFHVKVDMVVLSFAITDSKGKYVNGLRPKDFKVFEDDIPEKLA